jgi:pyrroline-5-carboxylate reductase
MKIGIIGAKGRLGSELGKLVSSNGYTYFPSMYKELNGEDICFSKTTQYVIERTDLLFLCVKPKNVPEVLERINKEKGRKIVVSTAACVSLDYLESNLNNYTKVVRIMPNLPIGLGKGVITYFPSLKIKMEEHEFLMSVLRGPKLIEVKEEELLDLSTILTGSMPAFISQIVKSHLDCFNPIFHEEDAKELYLSTLEGTLEMLKNCSPDEIIKNVSSPGGVTEKGIKILEKENVDKIIQDSVWESTKSLMEIKENFRVINKN